MTTRLKVSAGDYLRELEAIREFINSRQIASVLVDAGNAMNMRAVDAYFEDHFIVKGNVIPHTLSREEMALFSLHPATVTQYDSRKVYYKSIFIGEMEE